MTKKDNNHPSQQANNKRSVLKAVLIGFAVGVMFIVSAKMVNLVIT